ncbi:SDR family oxidoreductase [Mycolicibacterium sp.]|uniref:SDR family oxidoreductase n=1 Tax=Mycolicibacterium sp. TaxID=2320850 RepID=UPI001A2F8CAD|nr:D-threitol dehydrogenase [Mycolicibacterium sp.]MBJ7340986.1 D-threitol dehydrogenase [Mycolicibacterium sp.]
MSESTQPAVDFDFRLDGLVALVTGGASGIGAAIASAFETKGATVAIADLAGDGGYTCDVSDPESVSATVAGVISDHGKIDILVNSAGIARLAPAEDLSLEYWDATIAINLKGTFLMCQTVGKHMLAAGRGAIINMASQAATVAIDEHVAYCASKFGVVGITKVLATEWGGRGVRVNSISPTVVLTDLGIKAWDNPKGDALKKLIPTGRFAYPDEIAAAAIFLASGASAMINGADLLVDGGYTIK